MHSHFLPPSINGREHEFDEILPEMFLIYAASIKAITTLFHCTSIGQDDELHWAVSAYCFALFLRDRLQVVYNSLSVGTC
jgi:hypothetical protein